ncbi:MAG: glycosyltransferase family 2 protein [Candidatus Dependentiae bacterium]|nr:glycosyltransferase family 2 protein [Candidatus Dependentiae bacterium]
MIRKVSLVLCVVFMQLACAQEKEIVVIIPSYNNEAWYEKNLDSVVAQQYSNWRAIYINDCSNDNTGDVVAHYINNKHMADKITLINNVERKGALYNIYTAIEQCPDNAVIITLDGDDWFAHDGVLARVNQEYSTTDAWLTYGAYQEYPGGGIGGGRQVPEEIINNNAIRRAPWYTTHLRTFYAWLFKRINKEDLMYDGKFFEVTWDQAFMFPMVEMAAQHAHHIPEVLYIYNQATPLNDFKVRLRLQLQMEKVIRSKERYSPIE